MTTVDLNCDLGESFGRYSLGNDEKVIPLITSCNVACGMHAGDPLVINQTVKRAIAAGVSIGAHPGYPDLQGFGRRDMALSLDEAYSYLVYQIGALQGFCATHNTRLSHVKPHGQLYNRCSVDLEFSRVIARAVYDIDPSLVLVGLANGKLIEAGKECGLTTAQEFFTDRNYTDEGVLVSRANPEALITDEDFAIKRLLTVLEEGTLTSITGKTIELTVDTVCVHGDNNHALQFVSQIREALSTAGIKMAPVKA